jgi:hypothetical protein
MKTTSLLLLVAMLSSCAKKNESAHQLLPASLNPQLAQSKLAPKQIPNLFMKSLAEASLESTFSLGSFPWKTNHRLNFEKEVENSAYEMFKHEVARMAYSENYGLNQKMKINTLEKTQKSPLFCLSFPEFSEKHKDYASLMNNESLEQQVLSFSHQFEIENYDQIQKIDQIKYDLMLNDLVVASSDGLRKVFDFRQARFYNDEVYNPKVVFDKNAKSINLHERNFCLFARVTDFNFEMDGMAYNFKENNEVIANAQAHLVIIQNGKIERKSLPLEHGTLMTYLQQNHYAPVVSYAGELLELYGRANQFQNLNGLNLSQEEDLQKKRWFYFASNEKSLLSPLEAGAVYLIGEIEAHDILKYAPEKKSTKLSRQGNQLSFSGLYAGDKLILSLHVVGQYQVKPEFTQYIGGYRGNYLVRDSTACLYQEKNVFLSDAFEAELKLNFNQMKYFSMQSAKGVISPKLVHNKLIYEFIVDNGQLVNGVLTLHLPDESDENFTFQRLRLWQDRERERTCKNRYENRPYEIKETHQVKKKLFYDVDVLHFGITR